MLAAFGVNVIGGVVAEWQLDEVKECALKLKEAEIDHMSLPEQDKDGLKLQWKQWFEAYVKGFNSPTRSFSVANEQRSSAMHF